MVNSFSVSASRPDILSVRKQEQTRSSINNIKDPNREMTYGDIKQFNKAADLIVKIGPSRELMVKLGPSLESPGALKDTFMDLFSKLEKQNSPAHDDKHKKLESIYQKLSKVVQDVYSAENKK